MENKELGQTTVKSLEEVKEMYLKLCKGYIDIYNNMTKMTSHNLNEMYKIYKTLNCDNFPCVYFMRNKYTGYVKVGSTKDPLGRFNTLNSMCANHFGMTDALILEGIIYIPSSKHTQYEKQIHKELKYCQKYGEWFDISYDELINKYLPEGDYYNNILISFMCEDISNDGFEIIKINKENDINKIQAYVFEQALDLCRMFTNTDYIKSFLLDLSSQLNVDFVNYSNQSIRLFPTDLPTIVNIYNWCMEKNINLRVINYILNDDETGACVKEISFNMENAKGYSYEQAINYKIKEYFNCDHDIEVAYVGDLDD